MEADNYTPHKLRSRPLRCITLPAICVLIFIAYWLIICPILYVSVLNDSLQTYHETWPYWWPFAYWITALLGFAIILALIVCYWRCMKERERNKQSQEQEKFHTLSAKHIDPNQLYHVSLIAIDKTTPKQNLEITIPKNEKCNKETPNLNSTRPLSQISTASLPRSPLTPRQLFFFDLIKAANTSPISHIPEVNTFLENERRNCLPDSVAINMKEPKETKEPEFFIANVPNRKSLTSEVFLFIDGGGTSIGANGAKNFKLTMCDDAQSNDDVFVD